MRGGTVDQLHAYGRINFASHRAPLRIGAAYRELFPDSCSRSAFGLCGFGGIFSALATPRLKRFSAPGSA
jgi:hypothetical protein